jgi:hypothetical protein
LAVYIGTPTAVIDTVSNRSHGAADRESAGPPLAAANQQAMASPIAEHSSGSE